MNRESSINTIRMFTLCSSIILFLSACSSLPPLDDRTASYTIPTDANTKIYQHTKAMLEANPGKSGFHTLRTGEEAFSARIRLIMAAEKTVDAQYYIWHDDMTGRTLHNQLLDAADRGVRVRLLLDDLDTSGKDETLRIIDSHPNVEVRLFNPFANRSHRSRDLIGDGRRINHRMHNKTITADNIVTIFGGRNIGDEYFAAGHEVGFGDMDAMAIGPIANEVSSQFDLYWNSEYVYPIASFEWKNEITDEQYKAFRTTSDGYFEQAKSSQYAEIISQFDIATVANVSELNFTWSKWLLAYDQPSKVNTKKIDEKTHLAPKILKGIDKTENDLIIVSPYFVPGEWFTQHLIDTVNRGVRVRILTNSLQANDVGLVHAGYMRYRKDLLEGGVELYEFKADANKAKHKSKLKHIGASKASLHAKFFGFDKTYLFIGSFNLDGRSAIFNTELGAYFSSPKEAKALADNFDDNVIDLAYKVELDKEGDLSWVTNEDDQELRFDHEPNTTWWKRFSTSFLSLIVPEKQL